MTIRLEGNGANRYWNVHRSLEMLQGLQSAAMQLIREMDNHVVQRDSGSGKHPCMIGNAVAATVLSSYAAEIALKTLHAQIRPNEAPPRGHYLLELYDELDPAIKAEAQQLLCESPPMGRQEWIGANPQIRDLIEQGNSNFSDWRYLPEKASVGGGVPKVLVNVVKVMQKLCLKYVLGSSH